jgi:hypothetical protein
MLPAHKQCQQESEIAHLRWPAAQIGNGSADSSPAATKARPPTPAMPIQPVLICKAMDSL